jgi:hypothetical protein
VQQKRGNQKSANGEKYVDSVSALPQDRPPQLSCVKRPIDVGVKPDHTDDADGAKPIKRSEESRSLKFFVVRVH